jgi:hypothetical protein
MFYIKQFSLSFLALILAIYLPTRLAGASLEEARLPQIYLTTDYVKPTGNSFNVSNEQELQDALSRVSGGDEIVLAAGKSFKGPIVLPNITTNQIITIRGSNLDSIAKEGQRVDPSSARSMPKILAPGSNEPALVTVAGANHYRIMGIEFAKADPSVFTGTLISLGSGDSTQNSLQSVPHDIILDRVYVHGDPGSDLKRCIELDSAFTAIIDSYVADCHAVGQDAQAIGSFNGPGPFKIVNNYLEGSGENVLFGGADPVIADLIPSDIEFRNNTLYKPMAWMGGSPHWTVKNLFELKNARRVLISGNDMENNWTDGQSGTAVVLTPRNQDGNCNWCGVSDVTFENNIIRHSGSGVSILGRDYNHPSAPTVRIKIANNLFEDINGPKYNAGGLLFSLDSGPDDGGPVNVSITHNTGIQTGSVLVASGGVKSGIVFSDNLVMHNDYGVKGDSAGIGGDSLQKFFPDIVFTNNILAGGDPKNYDAYPGNFFPATMTEGKNSHPDIGADMQAIQSAAGNFPVPSLSIPAAVVTPAPPPAPTTPAPSPAPAPGAAAPSFQSSSSSVASSSAGSSSYSSAQPAVKKSLPGRPTGTLFKYAANPAVYYLENGRKRGFTSVAIFNANHFSFQQVITIPSGEQYEDSLPMDLPDNALVKGSQATVYIKQSGKLRPISSIQKFTALGYQFGKVIAISDAEMARESLGQII